MPEHFLLQKEGRVATLTFNRAEKRNSLNEEVLLEFEGLLQQIRDDQEVRVLIVTGSGNTFSAGVDVSQVKGIADKAERERIFAPIGKRRARLIGRAVNVLVNLEQITIAAVNGYTIGGGWTIALGCDFRIAVAGAEFWFPEVDLGVSLSPACTALIVAHVGASVAKDIIIGCRHFKAEELLPLGLVNRVVKKEALMSAAHEWAQDLANKNPTAVMMTKAIVNAMAMRLAVIQPDLLLPRE